MALNDAYRVRDSIREIARSVLAAERPVSRLATVVTVDFDNQTAEVLYPDDSTTFVLPCPIAMPAGPGDVVRVSGLKGGRYIESVVSGSGVALPRLILTETADATLSSAPALQIGLDDSPNLIIDTNEIMARNNGVEADLFIQSDPGGAGSTLIGGGNSSAPLVIPHVSTGDPVTSYGQPLFGIQRGNWTPTPTGATTSPTFSASGGGPTIIGRYNRTVDPTTVDLVAGTFHISGVLTNNPAGAVRIATPHDAYTASGGPQLVSGTSGNGTVVGRVFLRNVTDNTFIAGDLQLGAAGYFQVTSTAWTTAGLAAGSGDEIRITGFFSYYANT